MWTRLKEKMQYSFDNRMANSRFGLIRLLVTFSFMVVVVVTIVMAIAQQDKTTFGENLWDNTATFINAWMPSASDASEEPEEETEGDNANIDWTYLFLNSIVAIAGLFGTSVLIGIISTAIEEKVTDLKRENPL